QFLKLFCIKTIPTPAAIRSMKGDQSRLGKNGLMESSDIAVAQKGFRVLLNVFIIEQRQDPGSTRSSPQTNDGFDLRMRKHVVEVLRPLGIRPGQMPPPTGYMSAQNHLKP